MKYRWSAVCIMVILCLIGCSSSKKTSEEAKSIDDAYRDGVATATQDLQNGKAVIYVNAFIRLRGNDPETGLPYRVASADAVAPVAAAWVSGYNDTVRAHVKP